MSKSKKVDVTVMVGDAHMDKLDEVKRHLKAAGLTVKDVHKAIGAITGSATSESLNKLSQVQGVTAVERSAEYQIAPPESDVQ